MRVFSSSNALIQLHYELFVSIYKMQLRRFVTKSNDLNKLITINHSNKERIRNSITENLTRTTKIRKIPFNNFMLMITSMNILCAYVDRKNSFISAKEIIFFCLTRCFWNTKRMRILNGTCPDLKKGNYHSSWCH